MSEIDPVENERRMTYLETTVKDIVENHLPSMEKKMDKITWLLVTTLVAVATLLFRSLI